MDMFYEYHCRAGEITVDTTAPRSSSGKNVAILDGTGNAAVTTVD